MINDVVKGVTEFLHAFTDKAARLSDAETDLLINLDRLGRIIRAWPGVTKALGYTEAELLGEPIADFIDVSGIAVFIKSFGWYTPPRPSFKVLHRGGGLVTVRMEWYEFIEHGECLMILRLV